MKRTTKQNAAAAENQDAVRLPPLWGVRSGCYLTALYALVLAALFYFALVHPGLTRPGVMLQVTSEPWGAAVRVDDVYYAAAPASFFVPAGTREITVVMPGFTPFTTTIEAGNRVFASLLFPKRMALRAKLSEKEPLAALIHGAKDYAAWSFTGEAAENAQVPLSLSEGVYRSRGAPKAGTEALLKAAARFMATQAALKDLIRAEFLAASGGRAPSSFAALAAIHEIAAYLSANRAFAVGLAEVLPPKEAGALIDSPLYPPVWNDRPAAAEAAPRGGSPLSVEGVAFGAAFLRTAWTQNSGFQREVSLGTFYISLDEISVDAWNRFLAENPRWRVENRAAIVESGLASEDYLEPFASYPDARAFFTEYPEYPAPAMSAVSYYAAEAFCRWLSGKLPPALAGAYEVRLPTEAEWEYAAKSAERGEAGAPRRMVARLAGRSGELVESAGLWEWCADPYAPLSYLDAPPDAIETLSSPERSVRGGSWVNPAGSVIAETRGSLPPAASSPFTGFRVVLAQRAEPVRAASGGPDGIGN